MVYPYEIPHGITSNQGDPLDTEGNVTVGTRPRHPLALPDTTSPRSCQPGRTLVWPLYGTTKCQLGGNILWDRGTRLQNAVYTLNRWPLHCAIAG